MMIINARPSRRAPGEYTLHVAGRQVGLLRTGALVFCGYETPDDAQAAAGPAAESLAGWHAEREQVNPAERARREGGPAAGEAAAPGSAWRLLHQEEDPSVKDHGFELPIPAHLWVATTLGLAQRIWLAMAEPPEVVATG
jgi:hypothetical protein